MRIAELLNGKSILIWGYGREGRSTERFLRSHCDCASIEVFEGPEAEVRTEDFDYVIKSPGIAVKEYRDNYISQTELFLAEFRDRTVGITGTKGKSTTSTLLYSVLRDEIGDRALLVGNIGLPCLDHYDEIGPDSVVVFEMSCHQLNHLRYSPHIAVFLNLYEDHLDYYGTMDRYFAAKTNITLHQTGDDWFFVGENVPAIRTAAKTVLVRAEEAEALPMKLFGAHNRLNAHFVREIVRSCFGFPDEKVRESIAAFTGLKHRLEFVGEVGGVSFYDDSISTIPEATIAAARSIPAARTLLVGGMDRGIDYRILEEFMSVHPELRFVLSYASGRRILEETGPLPNVIYRETLEEAVQYAKETAEKGTAVVLSPAAASYGYFKNFEERGDAFAAYVKGLPFAKEADRRTSIVFTGDMGFDKYMEGRFTDPELLAPEVRNFLRSGDHLVVNVEGALLPEEGAEMDTNGVLQLKHGMPEAVGDFLENLGADVWHLNNNHIMDFGPEGLRNTLKEAKKHGALTLGAGMNIEDAARPVILPKAGGIGLIGVGYQRGCKPAGEEKAGCLPWNDMERIRREIEAVKATCRWCVIVAHGGEEFTALSSPYTRDRYLAYLEMGADAVVSHHPHVPMNYEKVGEKYIFYSLGNFIFDTPYQRSQYATETGVLVRLNFTEDALSFDAFGLRIDREKERVVAGELPVIFTDVPAAEYELLSPLATKMFLAATKRQKIYLDPSFKDADEEKWRENLLDEKRSGRVAGEGLDFILLCPLAAKAEDGAWKQSRLEDVKNYILSQM